MKLTVTLLCLGCLLTTTVANGQHYSDYHQQFVDEHIYEGMPSYDNIYIRQAYILSYNHNHRIANWVAYHIGLDYTQTIPRYNIFAQFRTDWSIPNPVFDHEYDGLYDGGSSYARGHLAPFNISGGDRDGDGLLGVKDTNEDGRITKDDMVGRDRSEYIGDADEITRVYQINQLSNVVPQDHDGFNGGAGIWRDLERYIQGTIVEERGKEVWVMAGPVLGRGEMEKVGPNKDITVPPMFFKIVVLEGENDLPLVLAFLLPHHKEPHGEIDDYLVSVDIIESMTGLDFFRELDNATEDSVEATDTWINWNTVN